MNTFAKLLSLLAVVAFLGGASFKCHSEQFYIAKQKLERLKLEPAQKKAIDVFAKDFNTKWRETHSKLGCSHHEDHADEFIAAASGVLTDDQFKSFRGRLRNNIESTGYQIKTTGDYLSNLQKLARSL